MKTPISSAGLLYLYLVGYEEEGRVCIRQINSYSHMEEGFYDAVMECARHTKDDEGIVHIFAVIGVDEKVNTVCSIIEKMIKMNFQNILSGRDLQKSTKELDRTGNCFSRCVQEFFLRATEPLSKANWALLW